MKKLDLFVCLFGLASHAATIHHSVTFNKALAIDTLTAADGTIYTTVSLADCFFSYNEGAPQLPVKTIN